MARIGWKAKNKPYRYKIQKTHAILFLWLCSWSPWSWWSLLASRAKNPVSAYGYVFWVPTVIQYRLSQHLVILRCISVQMQETWQVHSTLNSLTSVLCERYTSSIFLNFYFRLSFSLCLLKLFHLPILLAIKVLLFFQLNFFKVRVNLRDSKWNNKTRTRARYCKLSHHAFCLSSCWFL